MRFQRAAIVAAVCWTLLVGLFLMFGPTYVVADASYDLGGRPSQTGATHLATQFEINGGGNFFALVFPVILAAVPLFGRNARRTLALATGALLLVFSILAALSVGAFYLPAATLLLLSAIPSRDHRRAT